MASGAVISYYAWKRAFRGFAKKHSNSWCNTFASRKSKIEAGCVTWIHAGIKTVHEQGLAHRGRHNNVGRARATPDTFCERRGRIPRDIELKQGRLAQI